MREILKKLKIDWSSLYVGLNCNWLSVNEVIFLLNENYQSLNDITEELLIELNVNEDDKDYVLNILSDKGNLKKGKKNWEIASLKLIHTTKMPIRQKLRDIEEAWVKYDYPDEWRNFIYYMPNSSANSEEEVYSLFEDYLDKQ